MIGVGLVPGYSSKKGKGGNRSTQLGSTFADTFTSGSKTVRLTMNGSTISMDVGGVTRVSVTDTSITDIGLPGVRFGGSQTSTTGIQIDSVKAVPL